MQWKKKHLLLIMATSCLVLYFFGSEQNLPDTKFLRPIGYCCLGFSGLLQLLTN